MSSGFAAQVIAPTEIYAKFLEERQFDSNDVNTLQLELLNQVQTYELLGHTKEWAIKVPYFDFNGVPTAFSRVRILTPKSKMKYSQARASGSHIYLPLTVNWKTVAQDVDIPIIITEGEFKLGRLLKLLIVIIYFTPHLD